MGTKDRLLVIGGAGLALVAGLLIAELHPRPTRASAADATAPALPPARRTAVPAQRRSSAVGGPRLPEAVLSEWLRRHPGATRAQVERSVAAGIALSGAPEGGLVELADIERYLARLGRLAFERGVYTEPREGTPVVARTPDERRAFYDANSGPFERNRAAVASRCRTASWEEAMTVRAHLAQGEGFAAVAGACADVAEAVSLAWRPDLGPGARLALLQEPGRIAGPLAADGGGFEVWLTLESTRARLPFEAPEVQEALPRLMARHERRATFESELTTLAAQVELDTASP